MSNNNYKLKEKSRGAHGFCIYIGGGETVKQEINLSSEGNEDIEPVPSFCYRGFGKQSASNIASLRQNDNKNIIGFSDITSLIKSIYEIYGNDIFIDGFRIDNLDEYIKRAKKHVTLDYKLFEDTLIEEGRFSENQLEAIKEDIEAGRTLEQIKKYYSHEEKDLMLFIQAYRDYYMQR